RQHAAAPRGDESETAAANRGLGGGDAQGRRGGALRPVARPRVAPRRALLLDGGSARPGRDLAALLRDAGRQARRQRGRPASSNSAPQSHSVCGSQGCSTLKEWLCATPLPPSAMRAATASANTANSAPRNRPSRPVRPSATAAE